MLNDQNDAPGIPADAEQRKFTGIWIPAEIWLDDTLPALAKLLYAEIASFGRNGCWKKTEELMNPLGIGKDLFQKLCRQLKSGGYIEENRRFGRIVRTTTLGFRSSSGFTHQSAKPAVHQAVSSADEQAVSSADQLEYSKNKEKNNADAQAKPVENSKEKDEYGNKQINDFMSRWLEASGNDLKNKKRERRAAYNLLNSQTEEGINALLDAVKRIHDTGDPYAPAITAPSDLIGEYSKLPKLRLWVARHQEKPKSKKGKLVLDYDGLPPAYEITEQERAEVKAKFAEFRKNGLSFISTKQGGERDEK